jgi:hypothetical protein
LKEGLREDGFARERCWRDVRLSKPGGGGARDRRTLGVRRWLRPSRPG